MQTYILVFEDDPILGKVAIEAAKQAGFLALLDNNGNQYPEFFQKHGFPKAILLDLHLPFASGSELLKEFRANEHLQGVPIFIMTADILRARTMQEQGEQVLLKPVSPMRLQEILSRLEG